MECFFRKILVGILGALMFCPSIQASGLWIYEEGTPDMGVAAAGRAAAGKNASTAGGNPAAMTCLERSEVLAAVLGVFPSIKFDKDMATFGGGNGGNAGFFTPGGSFFYVHHLSPKVRLGVATGSYFGLGLDYDNNWAGRYYFEEGEFLTGNVNPVAAYRVNRWLSVGGGVSVVYSSYEARVAINNFLDNESDGRLKFDDTDVGYGGNVGVLIEPCRGTRLGITYRSKVDLTYTDRPRLKDVGPMLSDILTAAGLAGIKIKLEMELPQMVMVSGYQDVTDKLAIMANLGWQDWSEFGNIDISIDSGTTDSFTENLWYEDTWHVALGIQYRIADPWLLSAGFAYDTAPADSASKRTPALPLDQQIRYAAGIQYDWNNNITLGAAYTFLDLGDANLNQSGGLFRGDLKGNYKKNYMNFFGVNVIWRF